MVCTHYECFYCVYSAASYLVFIVRHDQKLKCSRHRNTPLSFSANFPVLIVSLVLIWISSGIDSAGYSIALERALNTCESYAQYNDV